VVLVALLVIFFNRHHVVTVWFFGTFQNVHVVWVMVVTAAGSIVGFWTVSKVWRTTGELRELRRQKRAQRESAERNQALERLEQKQRQIDQKLRNAIGEEAD
jgi:uncharacterized protein HemX